MEAPEGTSQQEGIFHLVLKEYFPFIREKNIDQNMKSMDAYELANIWNMIQPVLNQDNNLIQSNLLEGQSHGSSFSPSVLPAMTDPPTKKYALNINQEKMIDLIFQQETMIQKEDLESLAATSQKGGIYLPPESSENGLGTQSFIQNSSSPSLFNEIKNLSEVDGLPKIGFNLSDSPMAEDLVPPKLNPESGWLQAKEGSQPEGRPLETSPPPVADGLPKIGFNLSDSPMAEGLVPPKLNPESGWLQAKKGPQSEGKPVKTSSPPIGEGMMTPMENEKLGEAIKGMREILPFDQPGERLQMTKNHPTDKNISPPIREVMDVSYLKEGFVDQGNLLEKYSMKEGQGNPLPIGKEVTSQIFSEEIKATEKITMGKDEFIALSPKGSESNVESLLLGERNGQQQTGLSTNDTGKVHEPLLPRAETLEMYQQINKKIIWSIKTNEEKVRLTLDPPDLGYIYMEIHRDKENIKAVLLTNNVMTKEILEANQSQLHRILKEEGFKLEKFEVLTQQDMESFRERGETLNDHSPWAKNEFRERKGSPFIGSLETIPTMTMMNRSHRVDSSIDVFV